VTVAEAEIELLAAEVAVTETWAGAGAVKGAVYSPVELMVPHVAPVQPLPLTLQLTPVVLVPLTLAWNCCCPPIASWTDFGKMLTVMGL